MKKQSLFISLLAAASMLSLASCGDISSTEAGPSGSDTATTAPDTTEEAPTSSSSSATTSTNVNDLTELIDAINTSFSSSITGFTIDQYYGKSSYRYAANQILVSAYDDETDEVVSQTYQYRDGENYYELEIAGDITANGAVTSASRSKIVDEFSSSDQFYLQYINSEMLASEFNFNVQDEMWELDSLLSPAEGAEPIQATYIAAPHNGETIINATAYIDNTGRYTYFVINATLDETDRLIDLSVERASVSSDNWDNEEHAPINEDGLYWNNTMVNDITYGELVEEESFVPNLDQYFISSVTELSLSFTANSSMGMPGSGESHETPVVGDTIAVDYSAPMTYSPETALDQESLLITASSDSTVINYVQGDYGYSWQALKAGTTILSIGNAFNENLYDVEVTVTEGTQTAASDYMLVYNGAPTFTVNASSNGTPTAIKVTVADSMGQLINGPFQTNNWGLITDMTFEIADTSICYSVNAIEDSNPNDSLIDLEIICISAGQTTATMHGKEIDTVITIIAE